MKTDNTAKGRQTIKLLFANPSFQKKVAQLRKKWGINTENPHRDKNLKRATHIFATQPGSERHKWWFEYDASNKTQSSSLFHRDIIELMKQFGLDKRYWLTFLFHCITTNDFNEDSWQYMIASRLDTVPLFRIERQLGTGKPKILMELGEQTTLKDVKMAWRRVEQLRARLSPGKQKFKEWKNFERDTRIYQLYELHIPIEGMSSVLLRDGIDLDYGNIKKIISTYRKRLGIQKDKGKKLKTR